MPIKTLLTFCLSFLLVTSISYADPTWTAPVDLDPTIGNVSTKLAGARVVYSADGSKAVRAWVRGTASPALFASLKQSDGSWSSPIQLSDVLGAVEFSVAINGSGDGFIIWRTSNDGTGNVQVKVRDLKNGVWAADQSLQSVPWKDITNNKFPTACISPASEKFAMWLNTGGLSNFNDVVATSNIDGTWTPAQGISLPSGGTRVSALQPSLACGVGTAAAVWQRVTDTNEIGLNSWRSGAWYANSQTIAVGNTSVISGPSVAIDGFGKAVALWGLGNTGIGAQPYVLQMASRANNATQQILFSSPLTAANEYFPSANLSASFAGQYGQMVYTERDNSSNINRVGHLRLNAGSATDNNWGGHYYFTSVATDIVGAPSLAVNSNGDFIVAWKANSSGGTVQTQAVMNFKHKWHPQLLDGSAGVQILGTETSASSISSPTVTIDELGNGSVAWDEFHSVDSTGHAMTAAFVAVPAGPPSLIYSSYSGTFGSPVSVAPNTLNANGAPITKCEIQAGTTNLPAGLSIDGSTCVISGSPVAASAGTYSIIATNSAGFSSSPALVSITINAVAPVLSYLNSANTDGSINTPFDVSPSTLTSGGGTITDCKVVGGSSLPVGLSIDPLTCKISGSTATPFQGDYYIVATSGANGSQLNSAQAKVTLRARNGVKSFTVSTATISGCKKVTFTINLLGPAAAGGEKVLLSSTASALRIPTSVTFAAGISTKTLSVSTDATTTDINAVANALLNSTMQSVNLLIKPMSLSALTFDLTSISQGGVATGTVKLECVVPSSLGGVAVTLTSSKPSVLGLSTGQILVPVGVATATFQATGVVTGATVKNTSIVAASLSTTALVTTKTKTITVLP